MTLTPPVFTDPDRRARLEGGLAGVEATFAEFHAEAEVPGLAYGVVIDGELAAARTFGFADIAAQRPVRPGSAFRIASMTKSVTACCVCRLRDAGALALEDPVARHVPELADLAPATADSAPLTIRDLLTMSAGFVTDDAWGDRQLAMTPGAFAELLRAGIPFDLAPGTAFEYSNLGYAILGRVVAELAGTPLADVARAWVFEPLGMTDTTFRIEDVDPARIVQGYGRHGDALEPAPALGDGAFGAMAGMWTTVPDFARYTAMHLAAWPPRDDPETLPLRRSTLREMAQAWRSGAGAPSPGVTASGYGLGLMSMRHERDGRCVGHSGGLPGFGSYVEWLPDHGVGILAFANLTYARMRIPVRRAFDALASTGALEPRRAAPTLELLEAQRWLAELYGEWDDARADRLAAENLALDLSFERRRAAMAELRERHGECSSVEPRPPEGALRGHFLLHCAHGTLEAWIALTPTQPPRVQEYELRPAGEDG